MASVAIPLEAVQLKDGEELVSPGKGDTVSINIEATVDSIDDGVANISVKSANGIDMAPTEPGPAPETEPEPEMDDAELETAKAEFLASLEGQEI